MSYVRASAAENDGLVAFWSVICEKYNEADIGKLRAYHGSTVVRAVEVIVDWLMTTKESNEQPRIQK